MTSDRQPNQSPQLALFGLVSAVLLILTAGLVFTFTYPARYANFFFPTITPTATATPTPVYTPTNTPTVTLTPRPTWTLRPSETPTSTATPTITTTPPRPFWATLPPAIPVSINDRYGLADFTPELADQAAEMLRQLPGLKFSIANRAQPAFHAMYSYAVFAYHEALLRFPGALQAETWRWGLVFSLAQTGSSQAGERYASLISSRLSTGSLRIEDLPDWFKTQEPELNLAVHAMPTRPGFLGLHLLEIQPGDMYLWLTVTPNAVSVYPLTTGFIFDSQTPSSFLYADFTGDGIPELALYRQPAGDTTLYEPLVFDLSSASPQLLPMQNSVPFAMNSGFQARLNCSDCGAGAAGKVTLVAEVFPACPLQVSRIYQWDGSQLAYKGLSFSAFPAAETLANCETTLKLSNDFYPPAANLALLQALEPLWPPQLDLKGHLYPSDSSDILRLRIGIAQGLSANPAAMQTTFSQIVEENWRQAAQPFQNAASQADLFTACQAQSLCNPHQAFAQILAGSGAENVESAFGMLLNAHIGMVSSGIFDFDQNGQMERWLTIKPRPGEALEFWILAVAPSGVRLLYVDQVENTRPEIYFSVVQQPVPVFQFSPRTGYILNPTADGADLYIQAVAVDPALTTYTLDNLNAAEQSLFNGVSAASVRDRLRGVLRSGRFNCRTHQICDRFYYLLGLTYELAGDSHDAVETYLKVWWENKNSPYTTLARLKLAYYASGAPDSKATPTPTRTASAKTPTATHTLSANVTPTPTEDPYPLGTVTYTPSPTVQQSYP